MGKCSRCENESDKLYPFVFVDDVGKRVNVKICWDCDFEVCNGCDPFASVSKILFDRALEEYEYDPVNNPDPNEKRIN